MSVFDAVVIIIGDGQVTNIRARMRYKQDADRQEGKSLDQPMQTNLEAAIRVVY